MFIGNAIAGEAELRPSAIKGALRFWWRAMQAGSSIKKIHEDEAKIFGSADDKLGSRSKLVVNIEKITSFNPVNPEFTEKERVQGETNHTNLLGTSKLVSDFYPNSVRNYHSNILEYLSYGLHDYVTGDVVFNRYCIKPGEKFTVTLYTSDNELREKIGNVFRVFAWFGGLGAKSRNGFGQICILNDNGEPRYSEQPTLNYSEIELSSFSSFNKYLKIFQKKSQSHNRWDLALSETGWAYRMSRLKLDTDDTNGLKAKGKHHYENRLYIAQPIEVKNPPFPISNFLERHSKTYFLFVNKISKDNFSSGILHLPSNYSVENCEKYDIKKWGSTSNGKNNPSERYDEVHGKMNSNLNSELK